jgi:hypothetical protein
MNKLQRFEYCKNVLRWTYEEGKVFGKSGKKIGSIGNRGYYQSTITVNKKTYHIRLHQYIYFYFNNKIVDCIDHIDRNPLNNNIENLREVTRHENTFNKNAKGYYKVGNKFRAQIRLNGKLIHLGYFDTEQEAAQAYLNAKIIYHKI